MQLLLDGWHFIRWHYPTGWVFIAGIIVGFLIAEVRALRPRGTATSDRSMFFAFVAAFFAGISIGLLIAVLVYHFTVGG